MTEPPALLEVIAIDGPSGAGKSTVAKAVARQLGWRHLDTGSMYRAVALWFLDNGIDAQDGAAQTRGLDRLDLRLGGSGRVWIGDTEVTARLRERAVEARVCEVAACATVRRRMRVLQRRQAELGPLVAEGRDMTSVVFPDARYKFYVDADAEVRARRRLADFEAAGRPVASYEQVLAEIRERDRLDSTRDDGPLVRVEAATYVDTTGIGIAEVMARIIAVVEADRG